jgi:hypothetical protein
MELFENLRSFDHIFVTGPQRSGTRICSKMISQYLKRIYIDEVLFAVCNQERFQKLIIKHHSGVFQCPGMLHAILQYQKPNDAIVYMIRPLQEILNSQLRINWKDSQEKAHYGKIFTPIADHKNAFWELNVKPKSFHPFEIQYHSLKGLPLWVPSEKRKHFKWNQTSP